MSRDREWFSSKNDAQRLDDAESRFQYTYHCAKTYVNQNLPSVKRWSKGNDLTGADRTCHSLLFETKIRGLYDQETPDSVGKVILLDLCLESWGSSGILAYALQNRDPTRKTKTKNTSSSSEPLVNNYNMYN
jgi:hypothetical protein